MEELGGIGAAVEGDAGVVDGAELGEKSGGPRDEAVVAAELDEEEEEEAADGPDRRDVEQVLDVATVPRRRWVRRIRHRRRCSKGGGDRTGRTHRRRRRLRPTKQIELVRWGFLHQEAQRLAKP